MCGIDGNFYKCIKALYKAPLACVQVNELRTGWFPTPFGVKQGDVLSPTLFAIYVNDLEETKLQKMLDIMNSWCTKWRLSINGDKTQIVHFRKTYFNIIVFFLSLLMPKSCLTVCLKLNLTCQDVQTKNDK
uniref:Uncharacterized protein n=1 Tax=Oryzias melastigma TaxID=30732 RepID=A0A3B3C8D8_ORYME